MGQRILSGIAALVFILSLGACGSGGPNSEANQSATVDDKKTPVPTVKQSESTSESSDLTQRTGVPFDVIQANRDTLPLLVIMTNLEHNMAVLQAGIWRGNYETIQNAATALANHAKIPDRQVQKIRSILGKKGLKNFVAADQYWHKKAKELARVADEKNMDQVVNLTTELIQRCANCHVKYREPLRDSDEWTQQ